MIFSDSKYIGKKLREYRNKSGNTQENIAEECGISEKHYGKLERGIFVPSLETFFRLTEILKIPMSEFGIKLEDNNHKQELIKEILLLNDKEIEFLKDVLKSLKKLNTKK